MIPLPKWIAEIFNQGYCPHKACQKPLNKRGVFGIGIREERIKKKKVYSFCYEYECPHCKERTVFTGFPTNFEDFIADLIDIAELFPDVKTGELEARPADSEMPDDPAEDDEFMGEDVTPKKKKKPGMTDKEAKDGMRLVRETEFYEDLLEKLGIKKLEKEPRDDENK